MKRFKDYITERKQVGKLYHFTNIPALIGILNFNAIASTEVSMLNRGKRAVSFTRNKNFHKIDQNYVGTAARITVNGDKLSDKYKIEPFSYYKKKSDIVTDESEESVISKKITDIDKYIIAIDVKKKQIDVVEEGLALNGITNIKIGELK